MDIDERGRLPRMLADGMSNPPMTIDQVWRPKSICHVQFRPPAASSSRDPANPAWVTPEKSMSTTKFLFLYRTLPEAPQAGMALGTFQPSPQQMQEMWAQWSAWKAKFKDAILENEENMKPGGGAAVCKASTVSDGPYIESKEILGGYTFIRADSL